MFNKSKIKLIVIASVALVLQVAVPQFIGMASAGVAFNEVYVRFDRMQELTPTTGTVCSRTPASATGLGTETNVKVEFPDQVVNTNYVIDTTAADWAVSTTNLPIDPDNPLTAPTAWPGITAPTGPTDFTVGPDGGEYVRFASGHLAASTTYCFNWGPSGATPVVTNGSKYDTTVSGEKALTGRVTTLDVNTIINDTEYATDVVADDNIVINAVVPPLFTMDLGPIGFTPGVTSYTGVDDFISDLSTATTTTTSGVEADITTNAPNGWATWVKDTNQGLTSALAGGASIPTVGGGTPANTTLAADSVQYGSYGVVTSVGLTASCTPAIDALYAPHGSPATTVGTLEATYATFATCTGTAPATADQTRIAITEAANINPSVPAANDYTDTIYFVGAGNF